MGPTIPRSLRAIATAFGLSVAVAGLTSCGGGDHGTAPDVIGKISLTPEAPLAITPGSSLQLMTSVLSTTGKEMRGGTVTFTSSAPAIATVSSSGQVMSVGPVGKAQITASIGTVTSNSVGIQVVPGLPSVLTRTSADPGTVAPGATVGDSVRFVVKDSYGNPIANVEITFSVAAGNGSASPAKAQTDFAGRAATVFTTGLTAGPNTLNAVATGIPPVGLSLVTVVGSVSISAVGPSPMTPGNSITIDGAGFDPVTTGDVVTIDGQSAPITSASATQLVAVVPSALPCRPTHQASVQVTANGATAIARQTLQAGVLHPLTVGSTVVLSSANDITCSELSPANGHYIVNVLNPSTSPTGLTPYQLVGATSIPAGTTFAPNIFKLRQEVRLPQRAPVAGSDLISPVIPPAGHFVELETNRALYARMKKDFRRTPKASIKPGAAAAVALAVPSVGQTRTFRVVQLTNNAASCSQYTEITARAVYVGTKAIVYEDAAAPLAGQMDSYFAQLGQEFDDTMYPSDAMYFGDPLVTDQYTDNDQHLNMVFTPSVPSTLSGFVISCDFFQRNSTSNTASNFGENFYARVPAVAGSGYTADTPDRWYRAMRATVVHEVKHIASYGAHLVNGASTFEESWLEESTAMIAEEVWGRDRIYPGASWKGNMLYAATLYCDVRPTNGACNTPPLVMFDHFASLYPVLRVPEGTSLFGRVSTNDFSFYYAAWSFIRHTIDRYAGSEVNFLRGLTQSIDATGTANLERQANVGRTSLMGNWSLALYLDENPAMNTNGDVAFPSWHLRDIYRGINSDFPTQFPEQFPLIPQRLTNGDFVIDNQGLRGGSFSPFELTAVLANTRTIGLTGSPPLAIAIARIE